VRRRTLLGAGLATLAAGSTAGVLLSGRGAAETPVASPLLDRATRGALRGDRKFLERVRAVWRDKIDGAEVRGTPHIVWAGPVPGGGRVAAVAQRVPERVASPIGQISYGLFGFVEESADGLQAISLEEMLTQAVNGMAVLLGRKHSTLMVLDDGRGMRFSPEPGYEPDGTVRRAFRPLDFRTHDGVAFEAIAAPPGLIRVALRADVPDSRDDRSVGLANYSRLIEQVGRGAPHETHRAVRSLSGADPALDERGPWDLAAQIDFTDRYGYRITPPADTWYIRGATADRRRFVVQTLTGTDDRIRLLLSLGSPRPVLVGLPDPAAPLPVQVRLPDGQGVVVAARPGRLRYRAGPGTWLPVAGDAALLPAAASEVEVTRPGRQAARVRLA
jgi:hypothetical protein